MKTHLTMQQLADLGFELEMSFVLKDDEKKPISKTQQTKKGAINIDTTYLLTGEFISQEIYIVQWQDILEFKKELELLFAELK